MTGGRKPTPIAFTKHISLKGKSYAIIGLQRLNQDTSTYDVYPLIIDEDDFDRVMKRNWYLTKNNYVASHIGHTGIIYLHNYIINNVDCEDKKRNTDHLNQIKLDNRKDNLEEKTVGGQNQNKGKITRKKGRIPEESGITEDEIPTYINYVAPEISKSTGKVIKPATFCIEFKERNIMNSLFSDKSTGKKRAKMPTTNTLSLREKLNIAKLFLQHEINDDPQYFDKVSMNGDVCKNQYDNYCMYFDILDTAGFQGIVKANDYLENTKKLLHLTGAEINELKDKCAFNGKLHTPIF